MLRRVRLAALLSCTAAACSAGDASTDLTDAVRDSAGVELVSHGAETVANAPELTPVEELRIGSVDGAPETQFVRIGHVVEAAGGDIWLFDSGTGRISRFDRTGQFVSSFGGRGAGPGEFQSSVTGLLLRTDTVLVLELGRLHAFQPDGTLLHTLNTQSAGQRAFLTAPQQTADGILVMYQEIADRQGQRGGPFRDSISVRRLDPVSATIGDPIRVFAGPAYHLYGAAGWYMSPLFAPESKAGIAPDGSMYFTEGDDYAIDIFAPDGRMTRRILVAVPRIAVTDNDLADYIERELASSTGGGEAAAYRQTFEKEAATLGHAPFRPVIGRIIAATDGSLFVERADLDQDPFVTGDASTWDLIGADGRLDGRVALAEKVAPRHLTGTHLYAVVRDADDVQFLVRYRIR